MSQPGANQTVGALAGSGGIIALGGNTLTTNSSSNTTLASLILGTGGLVKQGSGTLVLLGINSYSGGTTVSGGTLQGNTIALRGNILNNANVTFDQPVNDTYAGAMTGTGSLTKIGTGTLILSGTNTYTGATIAPPARWR